LNLARIAAQMYRHRSGVLDPFLTGLWGCYGLALLVSSYSGKCLKVRRDSDNTTQDIGFIGGVFDTASLLTFVGSANGFVDTWYDQSGGTNNIAQATTSKQPQIVDTGVYIGEVEWDGVDDSMSTSNSSGSPSAFTVHVAGRNRAPQQTSGTNMQVVAHGATTNIAGWTMIRTTLDTTGYALNGQTGSSGINRVPSNFGSDGCVTSVVFDRTQISVPLQNQFWLNGVLQTSAGGAGSVATGNFSAATWIIGTDSAAGSPTRLAAQTILIYETAQTSTTVASIAPLITPSVFFDAFTGFTTNLFGLYSLRRQLAAYGTGKSIQVRRSSDNTTQDINLLSSGLLDVASMLTFVGANNGFVSKLYDQSGNTNDFSQATAANQPQIVASGVYLGWIQFDGSNDFLATAASGPTTTIYDVYVKAMLRSITDTVLLELSTNDNTNDAFLIEPGISGNYGIELHGTAGGGGFAGSQYALNQVWNVICALYDRTQATGALKSRLANGGLLFTRTANNDGGTLPSGNFTANPFFLGARSGGVGGSPLNLESLAIRSATVDSIADVNRISRRLG
jgi:Alpha-L-arabinofuranosidase B, catalytic